ncbi:MAG: hypothetical protein ABR556_07615 [Pyrinomonadaceae bacterium]
MQRTLVISFALALPLISSAICVAQVPSAPQEARGVLRLRVKVRAGESTKGLSRKRFFLIKGSLEQNKGLAQALEQQRVVSRDCYYTGLGASQALIKWLKESDCESVYCREIEQDDIDGPGAVPEFLTAMAIGEKEFGNRRLALKWLTVSLPEKLRDGFYKSRHGELNTLLKQAETTSGANVPSVMTDRNGTAYFTDLEPGAYTLSNILATEIGSTAVIWNCEVQVKPGDLATEKPYLISNRKDKNVKCVSVERPVPVCVAGGK